ncbi:flagellar operon protein (TIGR03826 family) [Bacillus oleivorans]|uniref:Flagellar operon protein (TIGR03826 family) n=1 Tax=Bacillus oleivorans TaxID=1448271 RepID=A0A285CZE9_9BACI|nr:TIGR03826 family flagellar region protein [Bacillus oleivorans]SNX72930.1 flagellar operon protein (TIGR03826 family) [Bacillus oleivorans]
MPELSNCPNCDKLFVKSAFRDVCDECFKEEEKQFETVYTFIRQRENRTATLVQVVEGTGVPEKQIIKFIKKGRLQLSKFPSLTYPCEKCSTPIREGKLCNNCQTKLRSQIEELKKEQERIEEKEKRERTVTYHTNEKRK